MTQPATGAAAARRLAWLCQEITMIPNHIQNEIARCLGMPTIELVRFFGIDPDAQPGEPDDALKLPPRDHPQLPQELQDLVENDALEAECRGKSDPQPGCT